MDHQNDGDNTQKGVLPYHEGQNPPPSYPPIANPYDNNSQNYPPPQNRQPPPPESFQQPQGTYYAPPQSSNNMVVVNADSNGVGGACQFCHQMAGSNQRYKAGTITFVWAVVLFFLTGCCCWIPFVCDDCKDRYIYCNSCQNVRRVQKKQC